MSTQRKLKIQRKRRVARVRAKTVHATRMRVSVFRSLNHIYAQLIDDKTHQTLASCSTIEASNLTGKKTDKAKQIGSELAKRILAQGIEHVVFDRGGYLFHGRVKAIADGLKEGGVTI